MSKKKRRTTHRKTGLPPGTLVFTGERFVKEANVTLMQYSDDKIVIKHSKDEKPTAAEGFQVTWYDIRGVHDLALIEKIGKKFAIHPLALEDIVDTQQRPKFEEYPEGLFITLRALQFDPKLLLLHTEQVSVYIGKKFLLSFQEDDDDLFAQVRKRLESSSGRIRQRGSDYLAYALVDSIVDHYFIVLDKVEMAIEDIGEAIIKNSDSRIKGQIHQLKLQALSLRKSVSPLREAIGRFSKCESQLLSEDTLVFVRDLYDHLIQIMDMVETFRDVVTGLNDLYISELSFKMNNIMKILTIITTIFVPLSFLAGLYGMNFDHMPELHWEYGYFLLLGLMFFIFVGLMLFFNQKKWL